MFGFRKPTTPHIDTNEERIEEVLTRGVVDVVEKGHLAERLRSGEMLRVKLGIDPTSPHIHLGRAAQLLKLRDFQALGHRVVFIVGDATGVIGDTSDKESERPMLSRDEVEKNLASYLAQAGKIIDVERAEVRRNSEWLNRLTFGEMGELAEQFSVADFIARDNIKRRLDAGKRISLREMLYPLMQGYDSVEVKADVEIGGTDQWFNLLAGRTLQQWAGQEPQDILTTKLITGTDGRKMSSSWGNTITVDEEPSEMFGKVMRINDDLIIEYFTALTRVPERELERISGEIEKGGNPRDAKLRLAYEVVALFHNKSAADEAKQQFVSTIGGKEEPKEAADVELTPEDTWLDMLVKSGVVSSNTQARRMPVYVWEEGSGWIAVTSPEEVITDSYSGKKVKIGKKEFRRLRFT